MKRAYKSRWQSNLITAASVGIPLVMAASALFIYTTESWAFRTSELAVAAIIAWFGIFKAARVKVCVELAGVEVHNPIRRIFIPWERIEGFSLRTRGLIFGPLGHVDLKDGSAVVMFAIAGQNPALRPSSRGAQWMIEELNRLLKEARTGEASR